MYVLDHKTIVLNPQGSSVEPSPAGASIQLGYLSYQAENAFTKERGIPGECVVILIGQKSQVDYDCRGLAVDTPVSNAGVSKPRPLGPKSN